MRAFYVFKINEYFSDVYGNREYKMFKILQEMYYTREYDINFSYMYYEQILDYFDDELINKYIYNNFLKCRGYFRKDNVHIIGNNYEYTKIVVSRDCIMIKSNQQFPDILNHFAKHTKNTFTCDFFNNDYFWLKKYCQIEKNLVK